MYILLLGYREDWLVCVFGVLVEGVYVFVIVIVEFFIVFLGKLVVIKRLVCLGVLLVIS